MIPNQIAESALSSLGFSPLELAPSATHALRPVDCEQLGVVLLSKQESVDSVERRQNGGSKRVRRRGGRPGMSARNLCAGNPAKVDSEVRFAQILLQMKHSEEAVLVAWPRTNGRQSSNSRKRRQAEELHLPTKSRKCTK